MAHGSKARPAPTPASDRTPVPIDLLDAMLIEGVSEPLWKQIFDVIGYPAGMSPATFKIGDLVDHLGQADIPDELVEVLRAINELGSEEGVDTINAVADEHQVDFGAIIARPPRDAAAALWLAQREDPGLSDVYAHIQMQSEARRSPRSFREFRGKGARRLHEWSSIKSRLVAAVGAWCKSQHFGDHIDVRGFVKDGDAQIQIIHGHRLQKPVVIKDGRGRRTIELRPAHCDVVRYDWRGSWLRISPRSAAGAVVEGYRRMLGEVLFGDTDFFTAADYTLRPLQNGGQAALDASPSVALARVQELVWDRGGDTVRIKSTDCLAALRAMELPVTEGDFIEARIALVLTGRRQVRRNIHVKVPNRVDYRRDEIHTAAIDSFLVSSGIRVSERHTRSRDLWDLHPWAHTEGTWRDAYPDDVDVLVRLRALRRVQLERIAHPDRLRHGRALEVVEPFGISTDDDVPPRVITPTDVGGLELELDALIHSWRATLRLEGEVRDLGHGAFVLGERNFDSVHCAIAVLTRQLAIEAPLLVQPMLRCVTNGAEIAVLVPPGRSSGTGFADIVLTRLVLDERELWLKFMQATSVGDTVPAIWRAPSEARLIVDRQRQTVWLDGVVIDVPGSSAAYKLIEILAEAKKKVVTSGAICEALSPNRDEDFARKIKSQAKKLIESKVAIDGDDVIVLVRGQGYRLGVPSYIG